MTTVAVHCFRCDDVVDVEVIDDVQPLWCSTCQDSVLGPPNTAGDGVVWWTDAGLTFDPPGDAAIAAARRTPTRSTGGAVLGAAMLGLEQALFGPVKDDVPIVHVDDEPERDDEFEVHLDRQEPAKSWLRFRR